MTTQNKEINHLEQISESDITKKKKKHNFLLLKLAIIAIVIFFSFFFYEDSQFDKAVATKQIVIKNEPLKEENILEISDDEKYNTTLHDINISEIKEKGAEFVYQLLIKNQVQIEDLNNQIKSFKIDIVKIKNQEKFNRLVLNYIDLREKLFQGADCQSIIESYELLVINDEFLRDKIAIIKNNYKNISTQEKLLKSFQNITKQLMANEDYIEENANFLEKVRHNFKKLVIIRKTSKNNASKLEEKILDIEKALSEKKYQDALNISLTLDKNYFPVIQKFLEDLNIMLELQKADEEIIKYFKSLT